MAGTCTAAAAIMIAEASNLNSCMIAIFFCEYTIFMACDSSY